MPKGDTYDNVTTPADDHEFLLFKPGDTKNIRYDALKAAIQEGFSGGSRFETTSVVAPTTLSPALHANMMILNPGYPLTIGANAEWAEGDQILIVQDSDTEASSVIEGADVYFKNAASTITIDPGKGNALLLIRTWTANNWVVMRLSMEYLSQYDRFKLDGLALIPDESYADTSLSNIAGGSVLSQHLSSEVLAMLAGGNDPADFLGNITSLSQSLADPATSSGKWYYVNGVSGTMTGSNPPGSAVEDGGFVFSNGSVWNVRAAPPVIPQGDVQVNYFPDPNFLNLPLSAYTQRKIIGEGPNAQTVIESTNQGSFLYEIDVPEEWTVGRKICVVCRIKHATASYGRTYCTWRDAGGVQIGATSEVRATVNNVWADAKHTLTVPTDAAKLRITIGSANGTVYIQKVIVTMDSFAPIDGIYVPHGYTPNTKKGTANLLSGFVEKYGDRNRGPQVVIFGESTGQKNYDVTDQYTPVEGETLYLSVYGKAKTGGVTARLQFIGDSDNVLASVNTALAAGDSSKGGPAQLTVPANAVKTGILIVGSSGSEYEVSRLELTKDNPEFYQVVELDNFQERSIGARISNKTVFLAPETLPVQYYGPFGHTNPGNDAGAGDAGNPVKTVARALEMLGGSGTIVLYSIPGYPLQVEDLSAAGSLIGNVAFEIVGSEPIRGGTQLQNVVKTDGQVKVYESDSVGANPSGYLWEDGTPEASTLIPDSERHPLDRSRSHRLESTRIKRAASSTLVDALAELEASSDLLFYYDTPTGKVYFTHTNGETTPIGDFYLSSGSFIPGWLNSPSIEVRNGRFRYMALPQPTASNHFKIKAYNCTFLGSLGSSSANYGSRFEQCEFCGSTLDGFGGSANVVTLISCWMHDNLDDGFSNHWGGHMTLIGCVSEYNGGAGFIPAGSGGAGARATLIGCLTRKNSLGNTSKQGGFVSLGDVSSAVYVRYIDCVSIEDKNGFIHQGLGFTECINCHAENPGGALNNPQGQGFGGGAAMIARNCHQTGETAASSVTARNGVLVS
jgi:hypothetical protein